jgi:hypothetical protein
MVFDGVNLWVPTLTQSLTVVRAATGAVLATITGNGLDFPTAAAFDGERVLIVNNTGSVSLFKAADLSPLGFLSTGPGTQAIAAASDGLNFWIALGSPAEVLRF